MLDRIKSLLGGSNGGAGDNKGTDPKLAAAVLLVDAARADESYGDEEKERVAALLKHRFHLADEEVALLQDAAEERAAESVNLHRFTSTVKDSWSEDERVGLIELLWE